MSAHRTMLEITKTGHSGKYFSNEMIYRLWHEYCDLLDEVKRLKSKKWWQIWRH